MADPAPTPAAARADTIRETHAGLLPDCDDQPDTAAGMTAAVMDTTTADVLRTLGSPLFESESEL